MKANNRKTQDKMIEMNEHNKGTHAQTPYFGICRGVEPQSRLSVLPEHKGDRHTTWSNFNGCFGLLLALFIRN